MKRLLSIVMSALLISTAACTKKSEDVSTLTPPTETADSGSLSYSGPKVDESASSSLSLPPGLGGTPQKVHSGLPKKRSGKGARVKKGKHAKKSKSHR